MDPLTSTVNTLNWARIGAIDLPTTICMQTFMRYCSPTYDDPSIPSPQVALQAIAYISHVNPPLYRCIMQQYSANPTTEFRLRELIGQNLPVNQFNHIVPAPPIIPPIRSSSLLNYGCCVQGCFSRGIARFSVGPKIQGSWRSGKPNVGLKFDFSLDQANKGIRNGLDLSFFVSKQKLKACGRFGANFTNPNWVRSFTLETNAPNKFKLGVQARNSERKDVSFFSRSNILTNGRFVVSKDFKLAGEEIESTVCVLPFRTLQNRARQKNTKHFHKYMEISQVPAYSLRSRSTIIKSSLIVVLAVLFLVFVNKVLSFLKTKKLKT